VSGPDRPVRLALAGAGAIGSQHLDALARIPDSVVDTVVGVPVEQARDVAAQHGVPHVDTELRRVIDRDDIDAVVLATPTPMHAEQAVEVLRAGKHVLVEIPAADSWAGVQRLAEEAERSGLVCMVGHTRRFNPSHRWVHDRVRDGRLALQQLQVTTHFLRRSNLNARSEPRSWTDHLLWHHAAHTVDLLRYQTGEEVEAAHVLAGPTHPELGIAMDMAVHLRTTGGTLCALSLSFNNDGPLGTVFRYIGDTGTYLACYDELTDGHGKPVDLTGVDVPANGIEGQDGEFVAAIREGQVPEAAMAAVLPSYRVLAELDAQLALNGGSS
jgi:2-hydroxy-4-carboxymuconate semialdehyde hemiacetal dehydrogenase